MAAGMNDLYQALGRIEGQQDQILSQMRMIQERMGDHIADDQNAFSSIRATITEKFELQNKDRQLRFDAQDAQLKKITEYISWARGASWPILGLLGLIGLVGVGVLISLITVWWKIGKV